MLSTTLYENNNERNNEKEKIHGTVTQERWAREINEKRRNTILQDCPHLLDNICKSGLLIPAVSLSFLSIYISFHHSISLYGTVSQAAEIQDTFSGSMNLNFFPTSLIVIADRK